MKTPQYVIAGQDVYAMGDEPDSVAVRVRNRWMRVRTPGAGSAVRHVLSRSRTSVLAADMIEDLTAKLDWTASQANELLGRLLQAGIVLPGDGSAHEASGQLGPDSLTEPSWKRTQNGTNERPRVALFDYSAYGLLAASLLSKSGHLQVTLFQGPSHASLASAVDVSRVTKLVADWPDSSVLEQIVEDADAVVLCQQGSVRLPVALDLNRACLAVGRPWLCGSLLWDEFYLGPAILPGETPCYACLLDRLRSEVAGDDLEAAFEHHLRSHPELLTSLCHTTDRSLVAAALTATETSRLIGHGRPPATLANLLVVDLNRLATSSHRVLKHPHCPACEAGLDCRLRAFSHG